MKINFLSADVALTKTFTKTTKEPYPHIALFTSHQEEVSTSIELYKQIVAHAKLGHCLLKGQMNAPLVNERRKGATNTTGKSEWVCLDFDRHTAKNIQEELTLLGLGDISYTLQWSASHGMPGTEDTLSCHVFMLLSEPVQAPLLKNWLQVLNFTNFEGGITLSRDGNALCWPLDISTCQNDKLLYIAPPVFLDGVKDPIPSGRITFVKRTMDKLPVTRMGEHNNEILRKRCMDKKNDLRRAAGMPTSRAGTVFVGEYEVQNKPGQASVTGVKDTGEYIRLNLNGGDSWAYWHHADNFELVFNFKNPDIAYRTKELLPTYYTDLVARRNAASASPNTNGDLILAFRDKYTANYYNGIWNADSQHLELYPAKNETQLDHWMQSHGLILGSFVPIWTLDYLPNEEWIVDEDNHVINRFVRSEYMREAKNRKVDLAKECPTIHRVVEHMLGNRPEIISAFLNWFACIFQRKGKPITSWTAHGVPGTGKGTFFSHIATPLLHPNNVKVIGMSTLEDQYNGWLKNKLFIFVDEIEADAFKEESLTNAKLLMYITEPTLEIREMRTTSQTCRNTFSIMFASNKPQPVTIVPGDRRYNVGRFQREKLIISRQEREELIPQELQAFADYLHSHEACLDKASSITHTEDRELIARLSITSLQETANALKRGDLESLWNSMPDQKHLDSINTMTPHMAYASAYADLIKRIASDMKNNNRITRDELRTIFQYCVGNTPETPNKFTSLLRHCGIELKRVRKEDDRHYGMEIDWYATDEFKKYLKETLAPKPRLKAVK